MAFPWIIVGATFGLAAIGSLLSDKVSEGLRGASSEDRTSRELTPAELATREIELAEKEAFFAREFRRSEAQMRREAATEAAERRQEDLRLRAGEIREQRKFDREQQVILLKAQRDENQRRQEADTQFREAEALFLRDQALLKASVTAQIARQQNLGRFQAGLPKGSTVGVNPSGEFIGIPVGSSLTPADIAAGLSPLPFGERFPIPVSLLSGRTFRGVYVPPGKTAREVLFEQFAPSRQRRPSSIFSGRR